MSESDDFIAHLERDELISEVNDELALYVNKRNGIALWRAYRLCREAGEPVPEVILRYLDRMGRALEDANNAQEIAAAVEMEGRGYGGSAKRHMQRVYQTYEIVSRVHLLMNLPRRPMPKTKACRLVAAQIGKKADTVEKMFDRWLKEPAPHRKVRPKVAMPKGIVGIRRHRMKG